MEGFKLLYWHWLVFGMVLMLLELAVPSFTIFWFGLGALVVGLFMIPFAGISVTWQILIWVIASSGFVVLWFKVFKPRMKDRTMAGVSREAVLGETAIVLRKPEGETRGELRFSVPVLGSETWDFLCHEEVKPGDRVIIREVSGNTMIVKPFSNNTSTTQEG